MVKHRCREVNLPTREVKHSGAEVGRRAVEVNPFVREMNRFSSTVHLLGSTASPRGEAVNLFTGAVALSGPKVNRSRWEVKHPLREWNSWHKKVAGAPDGWRPLVFCLQLRGGSVRIITCVKKLRPATRLIRRPGVSQSNPREAKRFTQLRAPALSPGCSRNSIGSTTR
jgi:hypothetical protein